MRSGWRGVAGQVVRQASRVLRSRPAALTPADVRPRPPGSTTTVRAPGPPPGRHLAYAPDLDGRADPGEVVWTWVPFEDDPARGKDRPVLVVGRNGRSLLGLMLSSQDRHQGDPDWLPLGAGAWDGEHRPSWVRLDRVIDVAEDGIRREGAILDRPRFDRVATNLRSQHGWN